VRTFVCYDGNVQRLALIGILVGCGSKEAAPPAPPLPGDWQCFSRHPGDPAGGVTHVRQRVIEGRIESDAVFPGGASRLVLTPAGDHLEGTVKGTAVTARLLAADGSHWVLTIPGRLDEDSTIDSDGLLTVTSMESGTKTVAHFVPASCDVVVVELAKYP
jgi:hypothetical protein